MYDRRTTCKHATIFDGALEELCGVMQQPVAVVKQHLLSNKADMTASSAMAFRAVGGLYVTMCSHLCSTLPVPLYFTAKRASCVSCAGGRTREFSHILDAHTSGAPSLDVTSKRSLDTVCLEATSVSSLSQPLYDCHAALRVNAAVF